MSEPERFWSRPEWRGVGYRQILKRLHEAMRPATYLEIGVDKGHTLALAQCAAIAVDPTFPLDRPAMSNKPACYFFRCTSDVFFRERNPTALFGRPVDLAFLDGLHHYEVLLRDFFNTEKHCRRGSVILMHDCLPFDSYVARREFGETRDRERTAQPSFWAGDVWKTVAILKTARPDLKIIAYDAPPTGLIAVTNLDPASSVLEQRYFELVAKMVDLDLADAADDYYASLGVRMSETLDDARLSLDYWL